MPNQPRYAFVAGDPVNHSDPSGTIDIDIGPIEIEEDLESDLSWECAAGVLATGGTIGGAVAAAPLSGGASVAAATRYRRHGQPTHRAAST